MVISMEARSIYILDVDAIDTSLTSRVKEKVTEHNRGHVVQLTGFGDGTLSMKQHFLHLYRQHNLHRNQRETVLSPDDWLITIQLCLAQLNKQAVGEYDADVSDVILMKRKLTQHLFQTSNPEETEEINAFLKEYETFLKTNNVTDWPSVCVRLEEAMKTSEKLKSEVTDTSYLLLGSPRGTIESRIMKILSDSKQIFQVRVEVPLDQSFTGAESSAEVIIEDGSLSEMTSDEVNSPKVRPESISELYIERIMVDYIHLLLNSKSEISLGRVINIPDRSLDHVAFTHLKHESQTRGMSMFQTAVSYIMRLRLGGKSYAPDPKCKLNRYVKGLSEFTDLMHKLSNILEDELNPSLALKRIVNVLKNNILKGSCVKANCVKNVAEKMNILLEKAVLTMRGITFEDNKENAVIIGLDSIRAMHVFIDASYSCCPSTRVIDVLRDSFSSQHTPLRFPSLLSKFRSPLEDLTPTKKASLSERMQQRSNQMKEKVIAVPRFKANNEWSRDEDKENRDSCSSFPSSICENSSDSWKRPPAKRIFESIDDQEDVVVETLPASAPVQERQEEVPVVNVTKKPKNITLKEAKPKVKKGKAKPKPKVMVKGQRSLTSFFGK